MGKDIHVSLHNLTCIACVGTIYLQLKVDGVDEGQSVSTADWFQSALAKFRADK